MRTEPNAAFHASSPLLNTRRVVVAISLTRPKYILHPRVGPALLMLVNQILPYIP